MDSFAFLERAAKATPQAVYAIVGDEAFLKRQVRFALQRIVLGEEADDFCLAVHNGEETTIGAVLGDVQTVPLLGPRRLVIVENGDPFVTNERARLEKYVAAPSNTGVLVLDVKSWPTTTRLAKLLPDAATIKCEAPADRSLRRWCAHWAKATHGKDLGEDAADLLVELVGNDLGRLDQELAKLATYVGTAKSITRRDVDQLVGRGHAEKLWKILDHIGAGEVGAALVLLAQLLDLGEEPLRLLAALSSQLRKLVRALRLHDTGLPLQTALERQGIPPFARRAAEQQIRHLGRRRLDRIYDWLIQTDVAMKSSHHLPARVLLERLVIRPARRALSSR